ncbi:MAG: VTT domain-containing protein [Chloroflexota bacterium]
MTSASGRPGGAEAPRPSTLRLNLIRALVLLAVIGISAYIFTIRDQAERLAVYGYPGIFLISVLANATILLPAPGIAVVFAMGSVFQPLLVALSAGTGATIGEISAYAAGFSGQAVIERTAIYARIVPWMHRYGGLTTLLLAAVPNPFFDLAGMAAGALRMPLAPFLVWCLLGKCIKMLIFAYTGAYSVEWLSGLIR